MLIQILTTFCPSSTFLQTCLNITVFWPWTNFRQILATLMILSMSRLCLCLRYVLKLSNLKAQFMAHSFLAHWDKFGPKSDKPWTNTSYQYLQYIQNWSMSTSCPEIVQLLKWAIGPLPIYRPFFVQWEELWTKVGQTLDMSWTKRGPSVQMVSNLCLKFVWQARNGQWAGSG